MNKRPAKHEPARKPARSAMPKKTSARPAAHPPDRKNAKSSAGAPVASSASSSTVRNSDADTSWERVAAWYHDLLANGNDTYQLRVILPNLLRLMRLAPGDSVLDIACGQGFFSAAFAKEGAAVTGTDLSASLIALAREHVPGAIFHEAPADRMPMVDDSSNDHATLILAIQNIEKPRETFAECARALKSGGRLHMVLNHPSFRIPKRSSWGWDGGVQYRRVDGYLTESRAAIEMHPGDDPSVRTASFHRPLQYYVKALARTGFAVLNLEEWISHKTSDSGPRAPEENRARKEIPLFMYVEAKKV